MCNEVLEEERAKFNRNIWRATGWEFSKMGEWFQSTE